MSEKQSPPKLALQFFRWFCNPDYVEDIEGDLLERFEKHQEGGKKAKRLYIKDVIMLFRPGIVRSFKGTKRLNHYDMLRHNIILALRNFKRYRTSFTINLIGLTTGIVSVFLIYLWVSDELEMDKFHSNDDRLYQVMHNFHNDDGIETEAYTPAKLAEAFQEDLPEIELATSVLPPAWYGTDGIVSIGEKQIKAIELYADENYFNIFSYPLKSGSASSVLKEKESVVISEELSIKLFGEEQDPIGKTLEWTKESFNRTFVITGVFENISKKSTQQFDIAFHQKIFVEQYPYAEKWYNSDPSTYVILDKSANVDSLNKQIKGYIGTKIKDYKNTLFLQKYSDRYLYGNYENGAISGGRISYVLLFSTIAIFILVIACINFMNLSTARASKRVKEIGVKKAMGATRKSLAIQHLTEAFILTLIALILGGAIVFMILPEFNSITGKSLALQLDFQLAKALLSILFIVSFLSGSYPAIYLSGFNPIAIFRGLRMNSIADLWARKGLVVLQFSISIMLISSVFVVSDQVNYIQTKNLGYSRDNIISFNADGKIPGSNEAFMSELGNVPGVVNAGMFGHDLFGGSGSTSYLGWEGKDPERRTQFGNLEVGLGLMETYGFEMIAGRTYSSEYADEESKIIFNEKAIEAMGLEDPVGKTIMLWGEDRQIIGVVKNFHFKSLYEEVKPCFIIKSNELQTVVVKIKAGTELQTVEKIEALYKSYNSGLPFNFNFFDKDYERLYASELRTATLSQYFASIAILISCLGLFGLASFMLEKRQKEIGIRKILGASGRGLVMLLSGDFSKMVMIAIVIALPISFVLMNNWLSSFAYRVDLEIWGFAIAGLASLGIAWLTIAYQTMKATQRNPVESIKHE